MTSPIQQTTNDAVIIERMKHMPRPEREKVPVVVTSEKLEVEKSLIGKIIEAIKTLT